MENSTLEKKMSSVKEGMPIHSVKTVLVFHEGMRLCEFGKNRVEWTGCFATFTDGECKITALYMDGIVYRIKEGGASC